MQQALKPQNIVEDRNPAIAFFGLGSMGLPMASHLVSDGQAVRGFDVSERARTVFAERGGSSFATAAEAAQDANVIMLMVVNIKQAYQVLFDANAMTSSASDSVIILMSTCPPGEVEELGTIVRESGRRFLDAPVSGGVAGAKQASLSIMVAGDRVAYEENRALLSKLGSKLYFLGERPGQASVAKAVNQLLCGVHLAAAAEAMALAERAGLDTATVFEIVSGSAASSWMLNDRGKRMLETEPEVTSAVDIFVKDLGIVLAAGESAKAALPLAAVARQFFLAASGQGAGAADDSQVIRAYRGTTAARNDGEK